MNKLTYTCPCHFGLESVLKFEAQKIGGENITVTDGKVSFDGDFNLMARANLCLATAERILIKLAEFKAMTFEELFQNVKKIDWQDFIGKYDAFPVKGHSLNSKLSSVPACQSIIKKAVAEKLGSVYGVGFLEETGSVYQIRFHLMNDVASIYLDTSGTGLHKRGYRRDANAAPIKETLAAGMIDLARIRSSSQFYDPFCGSGTLVIEAAYKALNIAPGLKRTFSAERWNCVDKKIWSEERQRALDVIKKDEPFHAYASDIDEECVELTLNNCKKAGISKCVDVRRADIKDFVNADNSIIVCNPPYGERLLEIKEAEEIYTTMGKVFAGDKEHPCSIISPHEEFEKFFGRKAARRRKLYNGMMKCQMFMYF